MTTTDTTTSEQEQAQPQSFFEWLRGLLHRFLVQTGLEVEPSMEEPESVAASGEENPAAEAEEDIIIAPGGFRIQRPKTQSIAINVDVTSFDALDPEVRKDLSLLPPLPAVVMELLKEIQNTSSSANTVADIAANDPSLAASLLRAVNSAAFGLSQKVNSVSQAVSLLGFKSVRNMVVRLRLEAILPPRTPEAATAAEDLWVHSMAVSYIAGALAARVPDVDRGFVSTLGLLHDVGRLAIYSRENDPVAAMHAINNSDGLSLLEREAKAFGADHTAIGAMLGNRWKLPADLTLAIRWHHDPAKAFEPTDPPALRKAVYLVHLANQLAKVGFAYSDDMAIDLPAEGCLELLGLRGSLAQLFDAKIRAATTQAILLAEENSKRPLTVVRPFLKLNFGDDAAALCERLKQTPSDPQRISVGDGGADLIDGAQHSFKFESGETSVPPRKNATSARFSAKMTGGAAKWLAKSLPGHLQEASVTPVTLACARATIRALIPNVIPSGALLDVAWKWDGSQLQLAARSSAIAFRNRLPDGTSPDLCRRALEAEWANILNLGWFDIETSKDGQTILLRSR
jgi:putative nucleotidyltransferase with HDIG domain